MSQNRQLLEYYQSKIDELYKERLAWLSRFDQCNSLLQEKQQVMQQLKQHKDKHLDLQRGIVHHDLALLDEQLNVVRMDRQNIGNEFAEAEQILKIEELIEEFPQQLEKHLPCSIFKADSPVIRNQLNIHTGTKHKKTVNLGIFRQNNSVLKTGKGREELKIHYKPTKEELLRKQISEVKTNQQKQLCLLRKQKEKLEDMLRTVRERQKENLGKERDGMRQLKHNIERQEKKYQQLADKYFNTRKQLKQQFQNTKAQNSKLATTVSSLQQKVNEQIRIYEKENKAKQTLIVRKSEDFQEDYKARMRAKERNLQALRDNYEKMQQVCIEKIKQLEETLTLAKHKLHQTEQKREQEISELKSQLFVLEKQVGSERAEKARLDQIMRQKIEIDKRKRLLLREQEEEERRKNQKGKLIEQAYRKPARPQTSKKTKKKQASTKKSVYQPELEEEEEDEEESMAMSDLDNIQEQIDRLSNKLEKGK